MLKKYKESVEDYSKGIELEPDDYHAYISRGKSYMSMAEAEKPGNKSAFKKSIKDFDKAINMSPDDPQPWFFRGRSKLKSGDYPPKYAMDDLYEASALKPDYFEPIELRARIYYDLGDFATAYEEIKKAITIKGDIGRLYLVRGACKSNLKKDHAVVYEDFNRAIELDPELAEAYLGRGIANVNLNHLHNGIKDLDEAIRRGIADPFSAFIYNGRAKGELLDYEGSIAEYTSAIELKPEFPDTYVNRGIMLTALNKHKEALADFIKAVELGYKDPLIYDWLGQTRNQLKDYKGAIADVEKGLKIYPEYLALYNRIGKAKYYLGDFEGAREAQLVALKIDPNDKWALEAMAFLDKEEAKRKAWKKN